MAQATQASGPAVRQSRYQLHKARLVIRIIAVVLLLACLGVLAADGDRCVRRRKAILREYRGTLPSIYFGQPSECWTEPFYGDLRTLIFILFAFIWNVVKTGITCIRKHGPHPIAIGVLDAIVILSLLSETIIWFYLVHYAGAEAFVIVIAVLLFFITFCHFLIIVLSIIAIFMAQHRKGKERTTASGIPAYGQPYVPPTVQPQQQFAAAGVSYANLPPPPPGMVYMVPAQVVSNHEAVPRV